MEIADLLTDELSHYDVEGIVERAHHPDVKGEDRLEALHHLALINMERGFDQATCDLYAAALRDRPRRPLATQQEPDASIRKDARLLVKRLDAL